VISQVRCGSTLADYGDGKVLRKEVSLWRKYADALERAGLSGGSSFGAQRGQQQQGSEEDTLHERIGAAEGGAEEGKVVPAIQPLLDLFGSESFPFSEITSEELASIPESLVAARRVDDAIEVLRLLPRELVDRGRISRRNLGKNKREAAQRSADDAETDDALAEFGYGPYYWNRAIAACNHLPHASLIFEQCQLEGFALDEVSYNSLLSVISRSKQPKTKMALHLLRSMRLQGLQPDIITYNCVIFSCAAMFLGDAERVIDEMSSHEVMPETKTYNALFAVMLRAKVAPERALRRLREMEEQGVPRDSWTFQTIMDICRWGKRWDIINDLDRQMHEEGVDGRQCLFLTTIATARAGDWRRAVRQLQQLGGHDAPRTAIITTIGACGRNNQLPIALKFFEKMEERFMHSSMDNASERRDRVSLYRTIFSACRLCNEADRVPALVSQMLDRNVGLDADSVLVALNAMNTQSTAEDCLQLFHRACDLGIKPTRGMLDRVFSVIKHKIKRPEPFVEVLPRCCNARGQLPAPTLRDAIILCDTTYSWHLIVEFAKYPTVGAMPRAVYETIAKAHAKMQNWDGMFEALESMGQGNPPKPPANVDTFNLLLSSCVKAQEWETASALLTRMREKGIDGDERTNHLSQRIPGI
jgi:pentatricopeptide repeat protein